MNKLIAPLLATYALGLLAITLKTISLHLSWDLDLVSTVFFLSLIISAELLASRLILSKPKI